MAPAPHANIVCYDLPAISRFFRSVALSVAIQQTTQMEWVTYRDSKVLNAVYTVLFWKEPPGTAEVTMANRAVVQAKTDQMHEQFLRIWIDRLATGGPQAAHEYVTRMERLRDAAREAVQEIFRSASAINNEVIGQTNDAIVALARIKLAATVGVAVIGGAVGVAYAAAAVGGGAAAAGGISLLGVQAGASATTFGVAGLGASLTNSIIKNWEQAPTATVAAINADTGKDVGKYVASEGAGAVASLQLVKALEGMGRSDQILRSLQGEIEKQSAKLAQEGLKRSAARRAGNRLATAQAQAALRTAEQAGFRQTARVAGTAMRGIPVVFAAWDILDAITDYNQTVAGAR